MLRDPEAAMVQLPVQSLAALQPNHDICHLVRQILFLAAESLDRHHTPLLMSQKIVQLPLPSLGEKCMSHFWTGSDIPSRTLQKKLSPGCLALKMKWVLLLSNVMAPNLFS
jgi:hypothetical protein